MKIFVVLFTLFLFFVGIGVPSDHKYIPNIYNPSGTPLPEEELECMIQNIYFEASTQDEYGKIGVAQATLNRVDSPDFPNTICGVVHQGPRAGNNPRLCQFSWHCDGKSDRIRNHRVYKESRRIALLVFYRSKEDFTQGATHYHAVYVQPWWIKGLTRTIQLGDHIFYRKRTDS